MLASNEVAVEVAEVRRAVLKRLGIADAAPDCLSEFGKAVGDNVALESLFPVGPPFFGVGELASLDVFEPSALWMVVGGIEIGMRLDIDGKNGFSRVKLLPLHVDEGVVLAATPLAGEVSGRKDSQHGFGFDKSLINSSFPGVPVTDTPDVEEDFHRLRGDELLMLAANVLDESRHTAVAIVVMPVGDEQIELRFVDPFEDPFDLFGDRLAIGCAAREDVMGLDPDAIVGQAFE